MAVVPPKIPQRPKWMSVEEYRKLLCEEHRMLCTLEKSQTVRAFFTRWLRGGK